MGTGNYRGGVAIVLVSLNVFELYPEKERVIRDWALNYKAKMQGTWSYVSQQSEQWSNDSPKVAIIGDSTAKDIYNSLYLGMDMRNIKYFRVSHGCGLSFRPPPYWES